MVVGDATDPGTVLGGDVQVDGGGLLQGHGTIVGTVMNDGIVSPGTSSIGILTVKVATQQIADGSLNIEVTPSTVAGVGYDQLSVTGAAVLDGGLAVQVDPGTYVIGSKYDILIAAGGVSGKFSTLSFSSPLSYVTPEILYTPTAVVFTLGVPTNSPAFTTGRIYAANSFVTNQALFSVMNSVLGGECYVRLAACRASGCRPSAVSAPPTAITSTRAGSSPALAGRSTGT